MRRAGWWLLCGSLASLPLGCVGTSLETGENHPANPNAAVPPNAETPQTLQPGFDPNGHEHAEENQAGSDHQHHHHHDPAPHHHDPAPADGGTE